MQYLKWSIILVFWVSLTAFLHYTLPQKDIVRITDTNERRIDFGENRWFWAQADAGNNNAVDNRDVFFIQSVQANGRPMVYRNEDTAWSWPPYFKFDSANLQTEASDLRSTAAEPQWVMVTHYGWRFELLTAFPNAINIEPVAGPDAAKGIPWFNIIILSLIAVLFRAVFVRWRRFREARIDPSVEALEDAIDERRARLLGWFSRK